MSAIGRPPIRGAIGASLLRGGIAFLVLFVVVHVLLATTTTGLHLPQLAELLLICIPECVFAVRRALSPWMSVAAAAMLLTATLIALTTLPTDGRTPGYAAWQFGAITIVLFGFALTGRYAFAAGTMAGAVLLAVGWSLITGQGAWPGVELVDRHVATLFVGTCYAIAFRRASASTREFHALARREQAVERAAAAQASSRRAAAEVVLEQAGPMLEAIAAGRRLSAADRRELLVLEGALRDRIRSAPLQVGPLPDAIAAARRRGTDVLLLGDAADGTEDGTRSAVAAWLADRLAAATGARFVARVHHETASLRVTAVSGDSSDEASFALGAVSEEAHRTFT